MLSALSLAGTRKDNLWWYNKMLCINESKSPQPQPNPETLEYGRFLVPLILKKSKANQWNQTNPIWWGNIYEMAHVYVQRRCCLTIQLIWQVSCPWFVRSMYLSAERLILGAFREAPLKITRWLFGHCPNSDCTPPPPPTQTGTLGHFIFGPIWATLFWWW